MANKHKIATCHPDRPHHSKGLCSSCYDHERHTSRYANPEYRQRFRDTCEAARKRRLSDPIKKAEHLNRRKQLREHKKALNPEQVRHENRKGNLRKYGLTPEDYQRLFEHQSGMCCMCGFVMDPVVHHAIDHDHNIGFKAVRGVAHRDCNSALGLLKEDPTRIKGLLAYAEKHAQ